MTNRIAKAIALTGCKIVIETNKGEYNVKIITKPIW